MDKHELIGLTLDQLLEAFKTSPESFEYEDKEYSPNKVTSSPTILWQPKHELKDDQSSVVSDPNNDQRTVVVMFNDFYGEFSCFIYLKPVYTSNIITGAGADASVTSRQLFCTWRSNYRKFMKLKRLILSRDKNRLNNKYLRKLCSVFPGTLDKHLLG